MKISKKILKISMVSMISFGFFLVSVTPIFAQVLPSSNQGGNSNGLVACDGAENCDFEALMETIKRVVNFIIVLATAIATIIFAWAGFLYLTAAGNASKISKAHDMIWTAVIGFLIALSAGLIVRAILDTLGYKF